ncbi:MAG: hypothetical protein QM722_23075 [Piscinibacter sp.]
MKQKGKFRAWLEQRRTMWARAADTVMRSTFELIVFPGQLTRLRAVLIGYALLLALSVWLTAGLPGFAAPPPPPASAAATSAPPASAPAAPEAISIPDILQKVASAYTPILIDIGIVVLLALLFVYRYAVTFRASVKQLQAKAFERLDIHVSHPPIVVPLRDGEAIMVETGSPHFAFDPALACTLQVSAITSDRLFQAVQGSLDFAKLTLAGVSREANGLVLQLGSCAYRDHNVAHNWAFVPLSLESTNETDRKPHCMFDLLGQSQRRWIEAIAEVVAGRAGALPDGTPPSFAPNTLGITAMVRVNVRGSVRWLMRRRGDAVAADEAQYCAAVAGLIDVYPDFPGRARLDARALLRQEYKDEVLDVLAEGMEAVFAFERVDFRPLGLVFPADANYQPELYFLADVRLGEPGAGVPLGDGEAAGMVAAKYAGEVHEVPDLDAIRDRIRSRDLIAIKAFGLLS